MYASNTNSITLFRSTEHSVNECVVFFSSLDEFDLNGKIPGTNTLLSMGYDVVTVQSSCQDWHQGLPKDAVQHLASYLESNYRYVYGYGLSMGGFAALAFINIFRFKRVLAISPTYRGDIEFDERLGFKRKDIEWKYLISPATDPEAEVFLIYDPNYDSIYAEKIKEVLGVPELKELKIRFSSHPSIFWLKEANLLEKMVVEVFNLARMPAVNLSHKKMNKIHFYEYALYLCKKNRYKWAIGFAKKSIVLGEDNSSVYELLALISQRMNRYDEAVLYLKSALDRSIKLESKIRIVKSMVSIYIKTKKLNEALLILNSAYFNEGDFVLTELKSKIYFLMGDLDKSSLIDEKLISLGVESCSIYLRLSKVSFKDGDRSAALRYARLAEKNMNEKEKIKNQFYLKKILGNMALDRS